MKIDTNKLYPLIVTLSVVAATAVLVYTGKISGDAAIALLGAVLMGALSGWLRSPTQ